MGKRSVLIVDDEQIMRDSIKEALKGNEYMVTVAEDGNIAKGILQRSDFDVVISDIKMPYVIGSNRTGDPRLFCGLLPAI